MTIEIRRISKIYADGTRALEPVSLLIRPGTFGLLGPDGAGKTTLMQILATLLPPSAGAADLFGVPLTDRTAIRQMLGYLPQSFAFPPQLTVRETLAHFAHLKGVDPQRRLDDLLEQLGLADRRKARVERLSRGMLQRLGLAVALLNDPRVLILDEPTANIDPEGRAVLRSLIAGLPGDRIVILSSHQVADVAQAASAVAVIFKGVLLFSGPPGDLIKRAEGQVWTVEVTLDELHQLQQSHLVVAAARGQTKVKVRCIGPEAERLLPAQPTLEDGYMALLRGV